jgi:PadR family transcriptional regulator PadR
MLPLSIADREIRLGIWKIHILHHAASRAVWGRWLLQELAEHGQELSPGTLYPALLRMEVNGWLQRGRGAPHARARQTFRITAEGRRLLEALRHEVAELYEEVVLGREPLHAEPDLQPAVRRRATSPKRTAQRRNTKRKRPRTRRRSRRSRNAGRSSAAARPRPLTRSSAARGREAKDRQK